MDDATKQQAVISQQLAVLQLEKDKLEAQLKKLTIDNASLKQQLGSSSGDIDMLQVHLYQESRIEPPCFGAESTTAVPGVPQHSCALILMSNC